MFKAENLRKNFLRAKQTVDQNLGRSEKSEVLSEDLQSVEKRVDLVKDVSQKTTKKIEAWIKSTSTEYEKRLKKMPETTLALSMMENASLLGTDSLMGAMYQMCGDCQGNLASHLLHHDMDVEKEVLTPLQNITDSEIPAINKLKKHLNKATLDMDSLKSRWQQAVKQTQVSGTNMVAASNKADAAKEHYEDSCARMQQARDGLATEMYDFVAREPEHSNKLLRLLEIQQLYHRKALEELDKIIPKMRDALECNPHKPVYGVQLEEHLRVTGRDIALVIEACVVTIMDGDGMEEEGLFRIAGMASKVKKLKTSFDAGCVDMDEYAQDIHCVAGALKQYLRELPEPLLSYELYSDFMKVLSLPQNQRLQALWTVVHDLPEPNYVNLRYLIKFLSKLVEKSDINKMTPSNIAIVVGPNLLWQEGDAGASMACSGSVSTLIEMIVSNADYYFPEDIDFHLVKKGTSAPRSLSTSSDNSTPVPTAVVAPVQTTDTQSSIVKACGLITTTAAAPITSHKADSMSESDVFKDNMQPSYQTAQGYQPHCTEQSPDVEFGNMSSFCSSNNSRLSDHFDVMDQEEALGGAPPIQEEDSVKFRNSNQQMHKSDSGSNLTAPIAEAEPSSPRSHRKHKLKPAPPPPPERPYSIAVTASFSKAKDPGQFQTWPRQGAPTESNEEKSSATKTRSSPDKPPLAEKPGGHPHRASMFHGDRPQGPPPDRPSKPPPAAPSHQRSASTGSANNTISVSTEQNGQAPDITETSTHM